MKNNLRSSTLFNIFSLPVYFISTYYWHNRFIVQIQDVTRPLLIVLCFSLVVAGIMRIVLHSWQKASLLTALFFFLFFNHDNISRIIYRYQIFSVSNPIALFAFLDIKKICAIALGVLFLIILLLTAKNHSELTSISRLSLIFSIGILGIIFGTILFSFMTGKANDSEMRMQDFKEEWLSNLHNEPNPLLPDELLPDIYYIILDGYGRADVLEDLYQFDNGTFINKLTNLGFTISKNSLSNYKQTDFSLSSLLNMEYLNWISNEIGEDNKNSEPIFFLLDNNRVFEHLRQIGYRISVFTSGYNGFEFPSADETVQSVNSPNPFEIMVIGTTPLSTIWDHALYSLQRDRIRLNLSQLAESGNQEGPDLIFSHVPAPHPPFVFGPNGEAVTPDHSFTTIDASDFMAVGTVDEYRSGYVDQLTYLNQEVIASLEEILRSSETPPIIIIQSDHGPGSQFNHQNLQSSNLKERYPILYAYILPCGDGHSIPNDITPVNSFRHIFNACFTSGLPYLENRQFYSSNLKPFYFTDVTQTLTITR